VRLETAVNKTKEAKERQIEQTVFLQDRWTVLTHSLRGGRREGLKEGGEWMGNKVGERAPEDWSTFRSVSLSRRGGPGGAHQRKIVQLATNIQPVWQ